MCKSSCKKRNSCINFNESQAINDDLCNSRCKYYNFKILNDLAEGEQRDHASARSS